MSFFCLLYIDWSCCANSFATAMIRNVDSFGPSYCFSDTPLNLYSAVALNVLLALVASVVGVCYCHLGDYCTHS